MKKEEELKAALEVSQEEQVGQSRTNQTNQDKTEPEVADQARNDEKKIVEQARNDNEKPKRRLWMTSDGYGFESKNFAENHARTLENKLIKEEDCSCS